MCGRNTIREMYTLSYYNPHETQRTGFKFPVSRQPQSVEGSAERHLGKVVLPSGRNTGKMAPAVPLPLSLVQNEEDEGDG